MVMCLVLILSFVAADTEVITEETAEEGSTFDAITGFFSLEKIKSDPLRSGIGIGILLLGLGLSIIYRGRIKSLFI